MGNYTHCDYFDELTGFYKLLGKEKHPYERILWTRNFSRKELKNLIDETMLKAENMSSWVEGNAFEYFIFRTDIAFNKELKDAIDSL